MHTSASRVKAGLDDGWEVPYGVQARPKPPGSSSLCASPSRGTC